MVEIKKKNLIQSSKHFVIGELIRRNYNVELLPEKGNRSPEILISNILKTRKVTVLIKAKKDSNPDWVLHEKSEEKYSKEFFYVFVNLHGIDGNPTYHIVPSEDVANEVKEDNLEWENTPGRYGQQHNKSTVRKFEDSSGKYLNKWENLNI